MTGNTKPSNEKRLLLALILSMLIWGMSWSSAKVLSQYGSAMSIAYIRFWFVVLALGPMLKVLKIPLTISKNGIKSVLPGGAVMGCYSLVFFGGLQVGMAGAGGVMVTTLSPIFAFLIGLILFRRKLQQNEWLGLAIGLLAGAVLLKAWNKPEDVLASGNLYFVGAAFLWAVLSKISSSANRFGHPLSFNLWMHITTCVLLSFLVDFKEVFTILTTGDRYFWGNILYFGLINSCFATATYLFATTKLGAEKASTFIFLVPVSALLGSWAFLNESVQWNSVVGGLVGIAAVLLINRKLFKS